MAENWATSNGLAAAALRVSKDLHMTLPRSQPCNPPIPQIKQILDALFPAMEHIISQCLIC